MAAINLLKSRVNCVLMHIGWQRGVVVSVFRRMIQVTQRRERLVLGWVTIFGQVYHHGT